MVNLTKLDKYFEDFDKWIKSFERNECGELDQEKFAYDRSVSNGEVWHCKNCKSELVINEQPNEDNY